MCEQLLCGHGRIHWLLTLRLWLDQQGIGKLAPLTFSKLWSCGQGSSYMNWIPSSL
jgi:hypothetical protein